MRVHPAWEHRLQAILSLLGGEPVPDVTARSGMGRSILYKWRRRALTALQGALTDHRPGPQCPANRLSPAQDHPLVELAQARGEIRRDIPSDALSHFILRSILGALRDWGLGADDRDRETALNYALTLVFDAIGTRP